MFAATSKLCGGSLALTIVAVTTYAKIKASALPNDRRGNLSSRVAEIAVTALAPRIYHEYTRSNEIHTVSSLPSIDWTWANARPLAPASSFTGNTGSDIPIFVKREPEFFYAGNLMGVTDPIARDDIRMGRYVRCYDAVLLSPQPTSVQTHSSEQQALMRISGGRTAFNPNSEITALNTQKDRNHRHMGDAIITGTWSPADCSNFAAYLELINRPIE